MAVEIALTDDAAEWLKARLNSLRDDWIWQDSQDGVPTLDDQFYIQEVMRTLGELV